MEKNIEMDTTILKKNLEITKLTQQIDSLRSMAVDLEEKLKTLTSINDTKSEIIESLTKHKQMKITLRGKVFNSNRMSCARLTRLIICVEHESAKHDKTSSIFKMAKLVLIILNTKLKSKINNRNVLLINEY